MMIAAVTSVNSVAYGQEPWLDHMDSLPGHIGPSPGHSNPLPDHELSRIPVKERPRPGYEPIGYRVGPTLFHPQLTAGLLYDSNVFAEPSGGPGDLAYVLAPHLTILSATPRFAHKIDLGAEIYRYREFSSENRIDAHARYEGRAEIAQGLDLQTRFEAARRHEERGDTGTPPDAATPIPYTDLRAEATLTRSVDRYGVSMNASARKLTYEDVKSTDGTTLDESERDGTIFSAYLKPFYEFSPGYRVFGRLRANTRDYAATGTADQDSRGYDAHAGLEFVMTPLISGSIEAGYLNQVYANPAFANTDGLSFVGRLTWLFTPLMTVKFVAQRKVAESITPGFGPRLDTSVGGQIDYELLRNVIVSAGARYTHEDFGEDGRKDKVTRATLGVDYLMNRHLRLGARYEYLKRNSNDQEFSFDRHTVMFNATTQY